MSTPTRLANNTIKSIEDALAKCARMRRSLRTALDRVDNRNMDPVLILALAHLMEDLTDVERILRDARQGRYEGECPHRQTDGDAGVH